MEKTILLAVDGYSSSGEQLTFVNPASKDVDLFCEAVRGTGAAGCSVRDAKKEIAIFMNTSNAEAIKICRGMVKLAQNKTNGRDGWRLSVYSALSRNELLASCRI